MESCASNNAQFKTCDLDLKTIVGDSRLAALALVDLTNATAAEYYFDTTYAAYCEYVCFFLFIFCVEEDLIQGGILFYLLILTIVLQQS